MISSRWTRQQLLLVVCDGMGGAKSGNVASRLATEVFVGEVRRTARAEMDAEQIEQMLRDAVALANRPFLSSPRSAAILTAWARRWWRRC